MASYGLCHTPASPDCLTSGGRQATVFTTINRLEWLLVRVPHPPPAMPLRRSCKKAADRTGFLRVADVSRNPNGGVLRRAAQLLSARLATDRQATPSRLIVHAEEAAVGNWNIWPAKRPGTCGDDAGFRPERCPRWCCRTCRAVSQAGFVWPARLPAGTGAWSAPADLRRAPRALARALSRCQADLTAVSTGFALNSAERRPRPEMDPLPAMSSEQAE